MSKAIDKEYLISSLKDFNDKVLGKVYAKIFKNQSVLEQLDESDGTLTFKGNKIGLKGDKGDKGETGQNGSDGAKGETGATGAAGTAATIKVGTVTAGSTLSVNNSGTTSAAVLDFVIPTLNVSFSTTEPTTLENGNIVFVYE